MRIRIVQTGAVVAILSLGLAACGGNKGGASGGGNGDADEAGGGDKTKLTVSADAAALKYQEESLQAPAGKTVEIDFQNPSQLPHTWVLVQPGQEQSVDGSAPPTGDAKGLSGVIQASGVVNAGASETIEVEGLQPGTYSYICTVPGHLAAGMKGTLTVQ